MSIKNQAKAYSLSVVLMIFIVSILTTAFGSEITGRNYELYNIQFKTDRLGLYQVTIESHERPSHETLPFISSSYFPYSTLSDQTEIDNTAPEARYHAQGITKVDVIFATGKLSQQKQLQDYIGAFESQLNAAGNYIDAVVEQVETQDIGFSDQFLWNFCVNGRIIQASSGTFYGNRVEEGIDGSITASGNSLTFKGYGESPIYDYALYPNTSDGKLVIEFTIREVNADWHTLDYSGFNIGCAPGNPHSGYSVAFTQNSVNVSGPGVNQSFSKPSGSAFTIHAEADPKMEQYW